MVVPRREPHRQRNSNGYPTPPGASYERRDAAGRAKTTCSTGCRSLSASTNEDTIGLRSCANRNTYESVVVPVAMARRPRRRSSASSAPRPALPWFASRW